MIRRTAAAKKVSGTGARPAASTTTAASTIETVITANDKEALLLENNLIKLHRPRFNVKLRDDKQYIVLRLDPRKDWPRLEVVRNIAQDGARYYGPFHSASRARFLSVAALTLSVRSPSCTTPSSAIAASAVFPSPSVSSKHT